MKHPQIPHPFSSSIDIDIPARLKKDYKELLSEIQKLRPDFRLTLKLSNLRPEDALEILYDGKGLFNRLQIINLKDFSTADHKSLLTINELQKAINEGSPLKLKTMIRQIILTVESSDHEDKEDRLKKLLSILYDVDALKNMYAKLPLKSRIGSDYTGKARQSYDMAYDMGFGIIPTLAPKAIKEIRKNKSARMILPASIHIRLRKTSFALNELSPFLSRLLRKKGFFAGFELPIKTKEWVFDSFALDMEAEGNIITLSSIQKTGKIRAEATKAAPAGTEEKTKDKGKALPLSWKTLNTKIKNTIKILMGFTPAFLCFYLTKDWWVLAYFGAVIWFGITGFRVILQSVLGGGGINRSSLLKWNNYVHWDRFTDALLFTGFSVPLLDYLVKTLILDNSLGINTSTNPVMLYMVMGLANGVYLSSHNIFRGLPKAMAAGNFFRSILSIPVAILFNTIIGTILGFFNIPSVDAHLQKWAAVISKAASDTVAGCLEGTVDRFNNFALRKRDITKKFSDLFETYTKLALLFPEKEELQILEKPEKLFNSKNSEVRDLSTMIIINALDLFHFWMYLPRARMVMLDMVSRLSPEEKIILVQSQKILKQEQYISRLFVDGILGRNFSRPLSFYLSTYNSYLSAIIKSTDNFFETADTHR